MKNELHFQPFSWLCMIYIFCFFDVVCMYRLFLTRLMIPFQKNLVHFFSALSGFHGIFNSLVGPKIISFTLKCDLRSPFSALFVPINAGIATGVRRNGMIFARFQFCNGRAIYETKVIPDDCFLEASAAFGMTIDQISIPNTRFISALTTATPIACSVPPLCQLEHCQFPEDLACQILHRWISVTATAFGPAALQQSLSHNRFIAAVT